LLGIGSATVLWLIAWLLLNLFAGQTSTEHLLDVGTHVLTLRILHVVISPCSLNPSFCASTNDPKYVIE
jgi:hypothetical protein